MNLKKELAGLTKEELIRLFVNRGFFITIEKKDIVQAQIDILSIKAETKANEAMSRMERYGGKDRVKWWQASKDHDKAMKIYDKISALYKSIGIP